MHDPCATYAVPCFIRTGNAAPGGYALSDTRDDSASYSLFTASSVSSPLLRSHRRTVMTGCSSSERYPHFRECIDPDLNTSWRWQKVTTPGINTEPDVP